MKDQKPEWWPKNPYPEDIFPMTREQYELAIPNASVRSAITGFLGRRIWNIAEEAIWQQILSRQNMDSSQA